MYVKIFFCVILTETFTEDGGLYNHRPFPEDLIKGKRKIKVIRDCGGMQRFSGIKHYTDDKYDRCQWESIPYERYECLCTENPVS